MLMKSLIALALLAGPRARLGARGDHPAAERARGRRLRRGRRRCSARVSSGAPRACAAAALTAVSVTLVGYQRVAKEDTLLGLFLMLVCLCLAEAKAAADDGRAARSAPLRALGRGRARGHARVEVLLLPHAHPGGLLPLGAPRRHRVERAARGGGPRSSASPFVLWAASNWTPFLPSTWAYARSYVERRPDRARQPLLHGPHLPQPRRVRPPRHAAVVLPRVRGGETHAGHARRSRSPGLGRASPSGGRRTGSSLSWMGVWFLVHSVFGSKWGRFFTSVLPAFLLLAGTPRRSAWSARAAPSRAARYRRSRGRCSR